MEGGLTNSTGAHRNWTTEGGHVISIRLVRDS